LKIKSCRNFDAGTKTNAKSNPALVLVRNIKILQMTKISAFSPFFQLFENQALSDLGS